MPEVSDSTLHVRLPAPLAVAVAAAAKKDFVTLSAFTRRALLTQVRAAGVPVEPREDRADGR
jgi:hypothetical protein